jgi:uncharacterized protein YllA (UPF0747 family)
MLLNIFGNEGLLVLDADDIALKNSFKQIVKEDMITQCSFKEVNKSIHTLVTSGLIKEDKIQVKPREINFFYMKEHLRKRIVVEHELYKVLDTDIAFDKNSLINEIDQFPERFSPNVVMRPVYQEFILPNLAYFGGAAEVSYWLELKPAFDFYNIPFPAVLLRNSAFALDTVNLHRCSNAGFGTFELIRPLPELEKELILRENPHDIQLKEEQDLLERLRNALVSKAESVGSGLPEASASFIKRMEHNLARLQKKFLREAKRNESDGLKQLRLARAEVFPGGSFQERKLSLFAYLVQTHEYTFIEELSKAQAPFGNTLACIENK